MLTVPRRRRVFVDNERELLAGRSPSNPLHHNLFSLCPFLVYISLFLSRSIFVFPKILPRGVLGDPTYQEKALLKEFPRCPSSKASKTSAVYVVSRYPTGLHGSIKPASHDNQVQIDTLITPEQQNETRPTAHPIPARLGAAVLVMSLDQTLREKTSSPQ